VAETEPEEDAPDLPQDVTNPFEVRQGRIGSELGRTEENAKRDGIDVVERPAGSQSAGSIRIRSSGRSLQFQTRTKPSAEFVRVPARYHLELNANHSSESRYATLVHELAHLYCGHLGTPNEKWWPDRRGLELEVREFEAESVCHLICERLGIANPSAEYLAGYLKAQDEVPPISLDCVMKAAGLIEQMGDKRLKIRKEGGQ
jgi:antirestriction protein ArdC